MSRESVTKETTTSEFDRESQNNDAVADAKKLQLLQAIFPEYVELHHLLGQMALSVDDLLDYVYNIQVVRAHGHGKVEVTVFDGEITKIDAIIRMLKKSETERHFPTLRGEG